MDCETPLKVAGRAGRPFPRIAPAVHPPICPICSHARSAAGEMLLDEMFVAFEGEAAVPFAAAVTACLQEAAAVRAAGQDDWWKLREAALYAVGTVSTSLVELAGERC